MGLQIERYETFQHRMWLAQRAGWVFFALVVGAAAVGLLGPGPLSSATATGADGQVRVDYQRFTHLEADESMTVTVAPSGAPGGRDTTQVTVELAAEWVDVMNIRGVTPRPRQQDATPYGLRLTFAATPDAELRVEISYRATTLGAVDAGVRSGRRTVGFGQFVYP